MDTLRGLLARERRGEGIVLNDATTDREYDARRLLTNAWKTGNFLHHCGVRSGHTVAVAGRTPEALLGFLGAVSLGAITRFEPSTTTDARAVIAPTDEIDGFELPPGGTKIAYGDPPDDAHVEYFERDVWSENPTLVPATIDPTDPVLDTDGARVTHAEMLTAAESAIESVAMQESETIAVRAPLSRPGTVAAGIVAPLLADAIITLPNGDTVADVAITSDDAPEPRLLDPADCF
ncbi:hypothetical protein C448_13826 [Halococcus morrhuae DSM 1307]|uniref:Acetyl-CoA synthetase n=1 Tax=Halococcus morrhuae DSM 1307 TaxID=931277 RepID=M0M3P3_HALMO|nr:hypothetical protein [Halococcus morrhuae]EMA40432.1 hypothetical protein C448_13826 [Halococcus morrhuae DSM 1307]